MVKAVFFDRDGVLNKLINRDGGYYSPRKFGDFKIFSQSLELTNYSKKKGYLNIVVSNQPDISRGLLDMKELDRMTNELLNKLLIDDIFYCFHDDKQCTCRKPLPGLIFSAQQKWNIDLKKSLMIGDTKKDLGAATNANLDFILINKDYNKSVVSPNRIDKLIEIKNFLN